MGGVLLGGLAVVLLAGSGVALAATAQVRRLAEFALAVYVVGYAILVALCLVLSLFGAMTRWALVAGCAAAFAASALVWLIGGARPPALPRIAGRPQGPVLALGAVALLALGYVAALVLGTPPNGWDQLNYHLARAALWVDFDRVGYVHDAYDQRINAFAPNGEIGTAFAMDITRNEVFAAVVQFIAALACATGVFALARRLGLAQREAAFGALLFLTLPIVLLQASSTKNDLVVASFLLAAAVFALAEDRTLLVLAGLATALAVGAKFTALYGVPVLLALGFLAVPRARRSKRVAALEVGAVAGLYWYALNVAETGNFFGDTSAFHSLTAVLQPRENLYSLVGLAVDTIDLSGARDADILLFPVAALVVGAGLVLGARRSRNPDWRLVALGPGLVASPLLLYVLATRVGRPALLRVRELLGNPPAYIPNGDPTGSATLASDTGSWFGPVGFLFLIGVGVAVILLVRRGALPRVATVCVVAPLVWLVFVGLTLSYLPWQGRFFLFPVALSASLWGLTLRLPPVAWAATALAAVTACLSLVHYAEKPSGVELLDRDPVRSVWRMPRWEVQSLHAPSIGPELRFVDEQIPRDDSLALALGDNNFGFPFFDPELERRVELVPFGSSASETNTNWLVANAARAGEIDRACWKVMFRSRVGTVFRRAAGCPT